MPRISIWPLRTELPLATLDDPLRKAAKKAGVVLLGK